MKYTTAVEWREEAMRRANSVSEKESERRRGTVRQHDLKESIKSDADALADYELYILGKMDIEEYQQYLLFKYGSQA